MKPGKDFTLFIDRDGVINYEKHQDYIHHWSEFKFYPDVPIAFKTFAQLFSKIIVVTNQKGIGKGLTNPADLQEIHQNMKSAIEAAGGRIDAIYYCPATDDTDFNRKPNPGMAFQAWHDFPDIDFSRSMMVGNNISDMQFGRNAGMQTVFLRSTQPDLVLPPGLADLEVSSLSALAKLWQG